MSKNDSITAKDIIHYLGVMILGLFLFFALFYYFEGNIIFSAVGTLIATLLLGIGLTYMLVKLKTVTQYHNKMFVWEMVVLFVGYIALFTIPSGYLLSKLVTVEFAEQENIQKAIIRQIDEINDMYEAYEEHVENKANNYEVELRNNGESLNSVNSKLITLSETLKNTDYLTSQNQSEKFISKNKSTVKAWNRLSIPKVLTETARLKQIWYNELVDISDDHEPSNEFGTFEFTFQDTNSGNLLNPSLKNTNWILTILVLLVLNALILWPYFFAKRSTRPRGHGTDDGLVI